MVRLLSLAGLLALLFAQADAYTAIPRWGQAVALVNDALFIYGGKSDPSNAFSYTSAPWSNDLLYLSLSSAFDPASPSWTYLAGTANASAPQPPALAWHTLSALNTSELLLFGGNAGPNSPIVLPTRPDSAGLLLLAPPPSFAPALAMQPSAWADEPTRRMRHTAAAAGGRVFLVGGERADGSANAFGDHWVFDPRGPAFTQLSSAGAPPDVYGHAALVLPDGRMLVFGGFSQTQGRLLPFDSVWALDTSQDTPMWSAVSVDASALPAPRMAFASTVLGDGRVLVHGGMDADMQNDFSDGWILDTGMSASSGGSESASGSEDVNITMSWQRIDALDQLGGRRDHFAITVGNQVVFGFGYATSAPADASMHIFNVASGSFQTSFQPMSGPPPHQTLPPPQPTSGPGSGSGQGDGSNGGSGNGGNGGGDGNGNGHGGNGNGGDGSGNEKGNGGNGNDPSSTSSRTSRHTAAIALGSILGALGLIAGAGATAWYVRRHQPHHGHAALPGSEDEESPDGVPPGIPMAGAPREKGLYARLPVLGAVGFPLGRRVHEPQRRDMLADEDRTFEWEVVEDGGRVRRDGSGGSASFGSGTATGSAGSRRSSLARARTLAGMVTGSWASLKALGSGRRSTREASGSSSGYGYGPKPEWEKFGDDAFGDEVGLMADRPRGGEDDAMPSGAHGPYNDPFADTEQVEVLHDAGEEHTSMFEEGSYYIDQHDKPPHPSLRTALPPTVDFVPTTLSPLLEQASSKNSLENAGSSSSQSHGPSLNSSGQPSSTRSRGMLSVTTVSASPSSQDTPRSPRPSSILDATPSTPTEPMRRSNSWWARFARTPLLDRGRSAQGSSSNDAIEFRDPNPPPRLITIEESAHSNSPDTPESRRSANASHADGAPSVTRRATMPVYGGGTHGKSVSSFHTTNTEALEHVGGTMDIIQRDATLDSQYTSPTTVGDDFATGGGVDERREQSVAGVGAARSNSLPARPLSLVRLESEASEISRTESTSSELPALAHAEESPVDMPDAERVPSRFGITENLPALPRSPSHHTPTSPGILDRIRAYERRMSREAELPLPPTNTRKREERSGPRPVVRYGLVPKPSLFVANPDHGRDNPSGD